MQRCKTFFGSLIYVEDAINDWLGENPEVTINHIQYCNPSSYNHGVVIIYSEVKSDENHI